MKKVLSLVLVMMMVLALLPGAIVAEAALGYSLVHTEDFTTRYYNKKQSTNNPITRFGTGTSGKTEADARIEFRHMESSVGTSDKYPTVYYDAARITNLASDNATVAATVPVNDCNFVKVVRESNIGQLFYRPCISSGIVAGDMVKITFYIYPTDIKSTGRVYNADKSATIAPVAATGVTELEMTCYPQYNGTGYGAAQTIKVIPNQWNTIELKFTAEQANANGFILVYGKSTYSDESYNTVYAGTMYLAGRVKIEKTDIPATLGQIFQDDMVFQRNKPMNVWGTSTRAGEKITVTIGDKSASTITDSSGKWQVSVPAMEAATGLTLTMICGDDPSTAVSRTNIAVGELILATGQSNMNYGLGSATGSEAILADAQTMANVRLLDMRESVANAKTPIWNNCDPASGDTISDNSAVGLITAYNIAKEENVPVGVIEACIGGSRICAFLSPEMIASRSEYSQFSPVASTVTDMATVKISASGLYNIWFPHLQGMNIGSVLWYQGEQDAQRDITANLYSHMLYDYINQLRSEFNDSSLPVIVCELAPYSHENFINVRQSQYDTAKRMDNVYLASTSDIGPIVADINNNNAIHPSNKLPLGRRCADILRYHSYGKTSIAYSGPEYENMVIKGSNAVLTFSNTSGYDRIFEKDMLNVDHMDYTDDNVVKRFGSSAPNARLECRLAGSITANQFVVTRVTPSEIEEDYPLVSGGAYNSDYLAKMVRTNSGGMLRYGNLVSDTAIKKGDKVRVKFRVYPTDVKLSTGAADTEGTVTSFRMEFMCQRGTKGNTGAGNTTDLTIIPNKWNDVEVEFVADFDGTNGFKLTFSSNEDGSYAGTMFFDGTVTVDNMTTGLYMGKDNGDSSLKGFTIAGEDGVFYTANATISGNTITVSSASVAKPVEVRYCYVAWNTNDKTNLGGNLYNPAGLPASPFKATSHDITITDVTKTANNTYSVTLLNEGWNEAPGIVVAALFDGDNFVQMKTVPFAFNTVDKKQESVVFNPSVTVTNPKVKVMAWKGFDTLVPYCTKVEK